MINPDTAVVERTIATGVVAGRMAVSGNGAYLYAAVRARNAILRYRLDTGAEDLEIPIGPNFVTAAMTVLPGQPQSILVARGVFGNLEQFIFPLSSLDVSVYDGTVRRPNSLNLNVSSFHVRLSDIYGWAGSNLYQFDVNATGVTIKRTVFLPPLFSKDSLPTWNGGLISDSAGTVVELASGNILGKVASSSITERICALAADPSGNFLFTAKAEGNASKLLRYSIENFRVTASATVEGSPDYLSAACDTTAVVRTWGPDGIAITLRDHLGLVLLHASGFTPTPVPALPSPRADSDGIVRLSFAANDLVFDAKRSLVWASVPGTVAGIGNSVASIDPATGRIIDVIDTGGEPAGLTISTNYDRLFAVLRTQSSIAVLDLSKKERVQVFSAQGNASSTISSAVAVPNQMDSVVVVRAPRLDYYISEIVIYDGGVPRPQSFSNANDPPATITNRFITSIFHGDSPASFYGAVTSLVSGDGVNNVSRFRLDAAGIYFDAPLTPVAVNGGMVYDNGKLFTGGGQIWTPDTKELLGTFSKRGMPVVFSNSNAVAMVASDGLTLFDLETLRPLSSLTFSWSSSTRSISAAVRGGPNIVAVSVAGETAFITLNALQAQKVSPILHDIEPGIRRMTFPVKAIRPLPGTSKLLFGMSSAAGEYGNSVVTFDPASGQIENTVFAGSEPSFLSPTPDGSSVYVALTGERRIARINLISNNRDLVFAPNPPGGTPQSDIVDMALGPDGGLAVSFYGGSVAIFDEAQARPAWDQDTRAFFRRLVFNDAGTMLYSIGDPLSELKRFAVSRRGIQWLSTVGELISYAELRSANGLLYTAHGAAVDPERSRRLGRFVLPVNNGCCLEHVLPDPAARRVYFSGRSQIFVFDMDTYAYLGAKSFSSLSITDLVKAGESTIAFTTIGGEVYLLDTSAIPLLPAPVPSPQPSLPVTSGVTVVDLATRDLAYDSSTGLIYATTPNREAAFGDRIVAIDPATGIVAASYPAGSEPKVIALSSDRRLIYYSLGSVIKQTLTGPFVSETVRALDLTSGEVSSNVQALPSDQNFAQGVVDLTVLPAQLGSIAVIQNMYERGTGNGLPNFRTPYNLVVYDNTGSARKNQIVVPALNCTSFQRGATQSIVYCVSATNLSKVSIDGDGARVLGSVGLSGNVSLTDVYVDESRAYTSTGDVIDTQTMQVIARRLSQGPVVVHGGRVYWLDSTGGAITPGQFTVTLRAFDATTLQPIDTKKINVTSLDTSRLVGCGPHCLAFRAGSEIYIVRSDPALLNTRAFFASRGGAASWSTSGTTSTPAVFGYGIVQADAGSTTPEGFGIFGFRQNGVLVTEASVPASGLILSGRIVADVNGAVNTGLAIANPNGQPAVVSFYFTNSGGTSFGNGSISIAPYSKVAAFLNEGPFNGGSFIRGTFTFSSSVPIAALALRGFTNERSEFLLTTLPVINLAVPSGTDPVRFPHFADGGGWTTQIVLVNPGDTTLTGTVQFRSQTGGAAQVSINRIANSTFSYSIPGRSSQILQTDGTTAAAVAGSVSAIPSSGTTSPAGVAIFSYRRSGVTVTEAGVPSVAARNAFRLYSEVSGTLQTGIAVANASTTTAAVLVELVEMDGNTKPQTATITIPGGGQTAMFLDQLPGLAIGQSFQGILRVSSSSAPISLTGLRGRYNERGDFLITTIPSMAENQISSSTMLYFPHVVDSGGYTMQFVLMNAGRQQSSSGLVSFLSSSGQPLVLKFQ